MTFEDRQLNSTTFQAWTNETLGFPRPLQTLLEKGWVFYEATVSDVQ